ncbi:MFS transporter [Candidatus Lariskella endosymbiont of Hedychridium roseum]|uniref:MFS transporter n=1 Tax=Candidatus Lariskella endosymbiont of Hedychridium roseum TaxID=3077949 RepID=UPI0030D5BCF8
MRKHKIVGSAIVGNIIEYYDFGIYAVFVPTIGRLFFPAHDPFIQLLLAFAIFAFGFLMRPLGGVIFGHIGDKIGRKTALTASILGMAFATFCIGLLPSYEKIGIFAPFLLVLIRLIQGVCIGGEGAGSAIFILEHLDGYKPGLIGSLVMASNMIGTLFATFIGLIVTHFFGNDDFSWRYCFLFGGVMGLSGLYLRHSIDETPAFRARTNKNAVVPIIEVLRKKWRRIWIVACIGGVATSVAYTIRGYLAVFFVEYTHYTHLEALYLTSLAVLTFIIILPVFGLAADKIGYSRFLHISCYAVIFTALPIFLLLSHQDAAHVLLGTFGISILAAAVSAPAYPYAIQHFTPSLRYSGVAFSWNIGNALFGGTAPGIETIFAEKFGPHAPAYYLIAIAVIFLLVNYAIKYSAKL